MCLACASSQWELLLLLHNQNCRWNTSLGKGLSWKPKVVVFKEFPLPGADVGAGSAVAAIWLQVEAIRLSVRPGLGVQNHTQGGYKSQMPLLGVWWCSGETGTNLDDPIFKAVSCHLHEVISSLTVSLHLFPAGTVLWWCSLSCRDVWVKHGWSHCLQRVYFRCNCMHNLSNETLVNL